MSALPRVSVAVPVFNEEHVLPELPAISTSWTNCPADPTKSSS